MGSLCNKGSNIISKFWEINKSQYPPVEFMLFPHVNDRFLIIDNSEINHIGALFKDRGKKSFAFSRMDKVQINVCSDLLNEFGQRIVKLLVFAQAKR